MLKLLRTTSENPDFRILVSNLDQYLAIRNGESNDFYAQFNKIDLIQHVVVAYRDEKAVGCGAIKKFDESTMEVKRMFVLPEVRGKGVAGAVLQELENWAKDLGMEKCVLETGDDMTDAIGLYQKFGYTPTPKYGQYQGVEGSVCFEKVLVKSP